MSFYIQEVIATGVNKPAASVTFSKGLNIISGVSDSGKSGILKCIYFLMGGSKPFDAGKTGYNKIELKVVTPDGTFSLSRMIGKSVIEVSSPIAKIQSGFYDLERKKKGNKNPIINDLWLKLIGIDEPPLVIKNQNYERIHLSWKLLSNLFWIREEDIEKPKSVILKMDTVLQTAFLSSFVYLLTGKDFADMNAQDSKKMSTVKRNTLQSFVDNQSSLMTQRYQEIKSILDRAGRVNIEAEVERLLDSLAETEQALLAASEENQDLLSELMEAREKETETQLIHGQFQELKSQYTADIQRLTFLVEGDKHKHDLEENTECPFCGSALSPEDCLSYLETSKAELSRIISQLKGLNESEADVQSELKATQAHIKELEKRQEEVDSLIDRELTPQAKQLKTSIEQYRSTVELQRELEIIQEYQSTWNQELQKEIVEDEKAIDYRPRQHFPDKFNQEIDAIAFSILKACHYEGLREAHLDMSSFDLTINRLIKEENHGKGYWAFINTVLGLALRKYIQDKATFKLGLFVVDTPLLGLDDGSQDTPESMRTSLFQYFLDHQDEGQMIIVENQSGLPHLDYEKQGAKVIEFTHDKYQSLFSESRYGFLYDVFSANNSDNKEDE